jgi:membrane peptidoglycan carboxypeptidase
MNQRRPAHRTPLAADVEVSRRRRRSALARRRQRVVATVHQKRRRRRSRIAAAVLGPLLLLTLIGGAGMAGFFPIISAVAGKPPVARVLPADSLIYDRNGAPLADLHESGVTRIPVSLSQISPWMQKAVVAVEDKNYWTEGAVDLGRLSAVAWSNVTHGSTQGASTIPMQLAKLLYLTDDRSILYKTKEIAFANDLLARMTKSDLLAEYLNDVPFAESAYGIEAAAHVYFGVTAAKLDLAQSALLAGVPNAPGNDDPFLHPEAAKQRQGYVLNAMLANGVITRQQHDQAAAEKLQYADGWADNFNLAPAFVARVYDELVSTLHVHPLTDGLQVHTTLDFSLQQQAAAIVSKQVADVSGLNVTDGALVAEDPRSGDVVAYVGSAGPDAPGGQIDMAGTPRQMGSTFKLFTYSTAFAEKRATIISPVRDGPITMPDGAGKPYQPQDYDKRWHGIVPVQQALGNSLNIPAIRVEMAAGIPEIIAEAKALGVTTLTADPSSYGPSMTLGTYPVPLWQMAQAATAFADAGRMHPAHFLLSVVDGAGKPLLVYHDAPKQAIDPGVAFLINAVLTNDSNRWMEFGRGSALTLPDHVVAAKTGTTNDFKDNLTVGWTPHLVTATWVGNADDAAMEGTTGITGAAPIWHDFMEAALKGQPDDWQAPPSDVHQGGTLRVFGRTVNLGGGAWFLDGTDARTSSVQLLGNVNAAATATGTTDVSRAHGCRYWSYNGARYWWCGSGMSNLAGDPGP